MRIGTWNVENRLMTDAYRALLLREDILTAEIINWTGKIEVAPRSLLAELAKREEVRDPPDRL